MSGGKCTYYQCNHTVGVVPVIWLDNNKSNGYIKYRWCPDHRKLKEREFPVRKPFITLVPREVR